MMRVGRTQSAEVAVATTGAPPAGRPAVVSPAAHAGAHLGRFACVSPCVPSRFSSASNAGGGGSGGNLAGVVCECVQ